MYVIIIVNGAEVRLTEDQVEVLDIAEGMTGEDILTFSYKGKTYKSMILMG